MQSDAEIPMRSVVFAWSRPTPPLFMGGAEISQHLLAQELANHGHRVTYIGSYTHPRDDTVSWYKSFLETLQQNTEVLGLSTSPGVIEYEYRGIACALHGSDRLVGAIDEVLTDNQVDLLISAQERSDQILDLHSARPLATVAWLHSVTPMGLLALAGNPQRVLATSEFVRNRAQLNFGAVADVFYPPFEPVPLARHGKSVTLVYPIPEKGLDTFLALARAFPDHHFIAVEGWYPAPLTQAPPNVSYVTKQFDMEPIWRDTGILLAPSTIEEGFGRVTVEAGLHGIPSIASATSGLAEALNLIGGGLLVADFSEDSWISALGNLLEQSALYEDESRKVRTGAQRFVRDTVAELRLLKIL